MSDKRTRTLAKYHVLSLIAAFLLVAACLISWFTYPSAVPTTTGELPTITSLRSPQRTAIPLGKVVSQPSPPPPIKKLEQPSKSLLQTESYLTELARAGDAAAASQLYKEMTACLVVSYLHKFRGDPNNWLNQPGLFEDLSPEQRIEREKWLDDYEKNSRRAEAWEELCSGMDEMVGDGRLYTASLLAAKNGNTDAADCYVRGMFDIPDEEITENFKASYRKNAKELALSAISRGDARMVQLMRGAYGENPYIGMYNYVAEPDPGKVYGYTRLLRWIADENFAPVVDKQLAFEAPLLPPEIVAQQEIWAKSMYDQFFKGRPPVDLTNDGGCSY